MRPEKDLGMEIRALSILLDRRMNALVVINGAEGITPLHGMILGFLSTQAELEHEVYQKDIEAEFDIARSTVAATLKLMDKKGYIRREGVAHDARLKRISLTSFGMEAFTQVYSSIQQSEALMRSALTEPEYRELMRLLDRVKMVL